MCCALYSSISGVGGHERPAQQPEAGSIVWGMPRHTRLGGLGVSGERLSQCNIAAMTWSRLLKWSQSQLLVFKEILTKIFSAKR